MSTKSVKFHSVTWAWALGWLLASMGQVLSGVYNLPNRGLTAFYLLGFAGWAIGAAGTLRYMRLRFGAEARVVALSAAGWMAGALSALVLGLFWMSTWNIGFLGPPVAVALGGAIGGGLTLPMRSFSSPAAIVRASLRGTFNWGLAFLVFQILMFYASYILVQWTVNPLVPILGEVWAEVPGWGLPACLGGFLAALLAMLDSRWVHLTERAEIYPRGRLYWVIRKVFV
jgi:hypothetical protein